MNDRRDLPSGEEELVRRAREGSRTTADDDAALRAATRWLDHVDDAVARTESLRPAEAVDAAADRLLRERVLQTLGRSRAHTASRMPWWRVWAPVTVAALLLGLFTLREVERVGPPGPEHAPARRSESAPVQDVPPSPAARPIPGPDAPRPSGALRRAEVRERSDRSAALVAPASPLDARGPGAPASVRAESLLAEWARLPLPDPARSDSIRAALETLRPLLEDDSLRRRVERALGPRR